MFAKRLVSALWSIGTVVGIELIRDQIRERRRRKIKEEREKEWRAYIEHQGPRPVPPPNERSDP